MTTDDPQLAWVTASRDLELERFRAYYAARFPRTEDKREKTR